MIETTVAPTSAIADVLALWKTDGWLTPPLQPIVPAITPVVGRALTITITTEPTGSGFASLYELLSRGLSGRVLVVAHAATAPGAVWGEILTRAAVQQGAAAVLVDGFVRDLTAMSALGLPVYAAGTRVVGPAGRAHVAAIDESVTIATPTGATTVAAGDMIVVDASGSVRLPAASADSILEAAHRYATAEDLVVKALNEGEPLNRAYRHKKAITDELRR